MPGGKSSGIRKLQWEGSNSDIWFIFSSTEEEAGRSKMFSSSTSILAGTPPSSSCRYIGDLSSGLASPGFMGLTCCSILGVDASDGWEAPGRSDRIVFMTRWKASLCVEIMARSIQFFGYRARALAVPQEWHVQLDCCLYSCCRQVLDSEIPILLISTVPVLVWSRGERETS